LKILNIDMNGSKVTLLDFWSLGFCILKTHRRESPHKLPVKFLNSSLRAGRKRGAEV